MEFSITIPADNDGYALFQCSFCGEFFKITPDDFEDDSILELCCPACALISDTYFTNDVLDLAMAKASNYAMDIVHKEFKKLERQFSSGIVSFKAGNKPNEDHENPIRATIDAMVELGYSCCNKSIKVKPLLQITGSYCPFCGVKSFETK